MEEESDTLVALAEEIGAVFIPLQEAVQSPAAFSAFMLELGWVVPVNQVPQPIQDLSTPLNSLISTLESGDLDQAALGGFLTKLSLVFNKVREIATRPDGLFPPTLDAVQFKNEFPGQLVQFLFVEYLLNNQPKIGAVLRTIGVIRVDFVEEAGLRPGYTKRDIAWNDLGNFFNDPTDVFTNAYNWGGSDFKSVQFADSLMDLGVAMGVGVRQEGLEEEMINKLIQGAAQPDEINPWQIYFPLVESTAGDLAFEVGVGVFNLPETAAAKPGLAFIPFASAELDEEIQLADNLYFVFEISADLRLGIGLMVRPNQPVQILLDIIGSGGITPPSSLRLKLGLKFENKEAPTILVGTGDGSRVELESFTIKGGGSVLTNGEFEVLTEAELRGGKIVIKAGEGDSFLRSILGENGIEGNFDLIVGWSSKLGVYFQGSGGLEISLPTHISLGPIEIQGLTIGIKPDAGGIPIELGADIKGSLGPLEAVVQGIGFKAVFTFPGDNAGNLGPVNLSPEFKWPTGVGLSIDAGGFTGGGFLFIDVDKGEYAGGLELEFQGTIALKAIGVLNTKMPDGSDGFSLLIIITAEFVPIQLGFGFTLNGVGGLLGLNRTMELEPLRLGVYDGSINSILFPTDIVANANRIIADIKRIFPPYEGQFVFGPMAKLGWGTPTLVSVELGLLIEVPSPVRLAILGVLRLALPTEEAAIVYIQINFIATLDFDKKQFTLDASLFNSRILTFALTGDMAIRIYWGENANFLFTIGGFHPSYTPPPMGLPALRRLGLVIFDGNPDLRVECYFAVTSNTVQFGAKLSLYVEAGPASVKGYLSFDALIQFNPFKFIVEIGAMLAVRIFGEDLLSIRLRFVLEGPSPWHAYGEGEISISFFFFSIDITVHFDVTFGEDKKQTLPPVEVFDPLLEAFKKVGNWRAELPAGSNLMVTMREIPTEEQTDKLILHPFGILEVTQKIAPLNLEINKFGTNAPLETHRFFTVNSLALGAETFGQDRLDVIKEQFAPASYQDMNDAKKLSSQSFAQFDSGVRIKGSAQLKASYIAGLEVVYEVIYVPERRPVRFWKFLEELFIAMLRVNATAKSQLAYEPNRPSVKDRRKVFINPKRRFVANPEAPPPHGTDLVFATEAEANVARANLVSKDASLMSKLQVVPAYQLDLETEMLV